MLNEKEFAQLLKETERVHKASEKSLGSHDKNWAEWYARFILGKIKKRAVLPNTKKLFIPVILGTNRRGRQSEKVAKLILKQTKKHDRLTTKLFDVRDFELPMDNYGQALKDKNLDYKDAIIKADGLIIIAPEYNHGYPGILKSTLDILLKEYIHKAVGLVGVSAGPWGGTRVIESLLPVVRELGLVATFVDLNFSKVEGVFDEKGELIDEAFYSRIDNFLEELIWLATTLRWGRESLYSKYH